MEQTKYVHVRYLYGSRSGVGAPHLWLDQAPSHLIQALVIRSPFTHLRLHQAMMAQAGTETYCDKETRVL
jgi:hypothetical protein